MAEDLAARRALAHLTISPPSGNGLVAELPGSRMAGLAFGSRINFGFQELRFRLLSRGGEEYLPESEAAEAQNLWRFGRVRLSMAGEPCWEGTITGLDLGDWRDDPRRGLLCTVDVAAVGLYELYQRHEPTLPWQPDEDADEDEQENNVTADEILREATNSLGGLIARRYDEVFSPGAESKIVEDLQKRWYDHIMDAVKLGTTGGDQVWFGVFFAADGPVLRRLRPRESPLRLLGGPLAAVLQIVEPGGSGPRWRVSVVSSGLRLPWDGAEYYNRGRALWSSEEAQQITDSREYPAGAELHHGVNRDATITLDRVGKAGGDAGLDTYLIAHLDPRAPVGSLRVAAPSGRAYASVPGADGAAEPGWRARCGDAVWLHDLLPSDPRLDDDGRTWSAVAARYEVDAAAVDIELDSRAVGSRRNERPAVISIERGALEPGSKGNVIVRARSKIDDSQDIGATPEVVEIIGGDGDVEFDISIGGIYHVQIGGTFEPAMTESGYIALGFSLDEEGWHAKRRKRTVRTSFILPPSDTGQSFTPAEIPELDTSLDGEFPAWLSVGHHAIRLWAQDTTGGGPLDGVRLKVRR